MNSPNVTYSGYSALLAIESALPNYNKSIVNKIVEVVKPGMRVLDFGAGIGTLAVLLREAGVEAICFEPDAGQREIISQRNLSSIASLNEIADGTVDLIYSSNVLEHIEADETQLSELARKLGPSGTLFLYLPAMMVLFSDMDTAIGHYRRYDKRTLTTKLSRTGFKLEALYYADMIGFFATFFLKLSGAKSATSSSDALKFYDRIVYPLTCRLEAIMRFPFGKNLVCVAYKDGASFSA
jgi:SAM-dependent methyltransferase